MTGMSAIEDEANRLADRAFETIGARWKKYGCRAKPTVPEVLPLVKSIYARNSEMCCLHVVLSDENCEDSSVKYCFENAEHEDCRTVAALMMRMSFTQRNKLAKKYM